MKINYVSIQSFRGIKDCTINFDKASTVLFGFNGAGKTSVLQAINLVYSNIINGIVKNRFKQGIQINSSDVKFGCSTCTIDINFTAFNEEYNYLRHYDKITNKRTHTIKELESFFENFHCLYDTDSCINDKCNIPIFVNYGVHRLVLDVPLRIRQHHSFDSLSAYEKAIENKIDFRTFFEWFRNREDYENEIKVNGDVKYEDKQLKCVKKAILSFLEDFSEIRVYRNPLAMKVTKGDKKLNVEQLSDGEKCALALIGDLARRVAIANPALENSLEGTGIVLIDEIELHLHPTWQRKIIPVLRKTFPNIQFIITTHSPQVLNEIDENMKVFVTHNDEVEGNIVLNELSPLNGWDINDILGMFMYTSEMNENTKSLINDIYSYIDNHNYNEADKLINKLELMTSKKNKHVIELRYLSNKGRFKYEKN